MRSDVAHTLDSYVINRRSALESILRFSVQESGIDFDMLDGRIL
jgi:hypothetical protein